MKKRLWLITAVASCLILGLSLASVRFGTTRQVQAQKSDARSNTDQASVFDRINNKAGSSKRGAMAETRELVDAVVDPYVGTNSIVNAGGTMVEVKDRLARAEVDYRQGHGKGIPEDNVIRVVNGLCKKFGAPDYAKTDRTEVRTHRMALLGLTPALTTIDHIHGQRANRTTAGISPNMSPIEAANVTMSLVYQKVFNEEYQKDATEREVQRRANRSGSVGRVDSVSGASRASQRTAQMVQIARRGSLPLLMPGRAKSFARRTLDILGIPAIKENK